MEDGLEEEGTDLEDPRGSIPCILTMMWRDALLTFVPWLPEGLSLVSWLWCDEIPFPRSYLDCVGSRGSSPDGSPLIVVSRSKPVCFRAGVEASAERRHFRGLQSPRVPGKSAVQPQQNKAFVFYLAWRWVTKVTSHSSLTPLLWASSMARKLFTWVSLSPCVCHKQCTRSNEHLATPAREDGSWDKKGERRREELGHPVVMGPRAGPQGWPSRSLKTVLQMQDDWAAPN